MTQYQDLIVSDRDRKQALAAMDAALKTMDTIMQEKAVTDQRGAAYTDNDTDVLAEGRKALDMIKVNPQGIAARQINESLMATAGRALDRADMMLYRDGFAAVKDVAWTESDRQVIAKGLERFNRVVAYQRN